MASIVEGLQELNRFPKASILGENRELKAFNA
jgi:hypothetical protein